MYSFIHAADIHLDSPLLGLERYDGAPAERLRNATRSALKNLADLALNERVAFVVIAGDLYDGDWRDYNTGLFFISQMKRLSDAGIPVFIAWGNHDASSQITRNLLLPGNVRVFSDSEPETFLLESLHVALHGRSYAMRAEQSDLSAAYPSPIPGWINIGVLHTSADGRPGHEPYAPCSADSLAAKRYEYWALGHVHAREVLRESPPMLFPGCIQGRHANEIGPKGAFLVRVEDRQIAGWEFRDLDAARWARLDVDCTGASAPEEAIERMEKALLPALGGLGDRVLAVRLAFAGSCVAHKDFRADPERWTAECRSAAMRVGGENLWLERVNFATEPPSDSDARRERSSALDELIQSARESLQNEETLEAIEAALAPLARKLPREWRDDSSALQFHDRETVRAIAGLALDHWTARLAADREAAR